MSLAIFGTYLGLFSKFSLVGFDVVHLHRVCQPCVCDSRCDVNSILVNGGSKQGACGFHGCKLLPFKALGIVRAHLLQAVPFNDRQN